MKSLLSVWLVSAVLGLAAGEAAAAEPAATEVASIPKMSQFDLLSRLQRKDPDIVVIDVRTAAEFAAGHVPGARNAPHDLLQSGIVSLEELRGKQVVLYCRSGRRTQLAADVLHKAGFKRLAHLEGDFLAWESEGRPIER